MRRPFATPDGLFHYLKWPFGLHGAPATSQWFMDHILRLSKEYAAAYLDTVIHGNEWESHLNRVSTVRNTLRRAGLTANPKKVSTWPSEGRISGLYNWERVCPTTGEESGADLELAPPPNQEASTHVCGVNKLLQEVYPSLCLFSQPTNGSDSEPSAHPPK